MAPAGALDDDRPALGVDDVETGTGVDDADAGQPMVEAGTSASIWLRLSGGAVNSSS